MQFRQVPRECSFWVKGRHSIPTGIGGHMHDQLLTLQVAETAIEIPIILIGLSRLRGYLQEA
jgi:hypothetical protein